MDKWIEDKTKLEEILREESVGWLGLCGPDGPYGVPLSYAYLNGKILFHCSPVGMKLDCIRENPRVCFAVWRQFGETRRHAGGAAASPTDSESVICFGDARILNDLAERSAALNTFVRLTRPDAAPMPKAMAERCGVVEVAIREMTGRQGTANKRTYWRYSF